MHKLLQWIQTLESLELWDVVPGTSPTASEKHNSQVSVAGQDWELFVCFGQVQRFANPIKSLRLPKLQCEGHHVICILEVESDGRGVSRVKLCPQSMIYGSQLRALFNQKASHYSPVIVAKNFCHFWWGWKGALQETQTHLFRCRFLKMFSKTWSIRLRSAVLQGQPARHGHATKFSLCGGCHFDLQRITRQMIMRPY